MDSSPEEDMDFPGEGGVWWACKYKLSNFVSALNYGTKCNGDSDCDSSEYCDTWAEDGAMCASNSGPSAKAEFGLNTGTWNMLKNCKAMTMATPTETQVPVAGPDGWIKYGKGE